MIDTNLESILGLLDRAQAILARRLSRLADVAMADALLATAEAALTLAEAVSQPETDPVALRHRLEAVYSCTRAACASAHFALVSVKDRPA